MALDLRQPEPGDGTLAPAAPRIIGSKPCGTRHIAEIDSRSGTQIVTVRTGCLAARPPRPDGGVIPARPIQVAQEAGVERLARSAEDDYDAL